MLHKNVTAGDNHIAYNWVYSDATARGAATGFVAADVGKLAWQTDNNTFWVLTATTPTWANLVSGGMNVTISQITDWPSAVSATEVGYLDGVTSAIQTQLNGKQASLGYTAENTANKNTANGYCGLDATGKVAAAQLPAYVDDVLEYANAAALPGTGTAGIIYVTLDNNKTLRWTGSAYVEVGPTGGATNLDGLTDVTITTPSNGQVLKYNGSAWVNGTDETGGAGGPTGFEQHFMMMGA